MAKQQVVNVLRHLQKAHGIPKEVTEDILPKKTPPFPMSGGATRSGTRKMEAWCTPVTRSMEATTKVHLDSF